MTSPTPSSAEARLSPTPAQPATPPVPSAPGPASEAEVIDVDADPSISPGVSSTLSSIPSASSPPTSEAPDGISPARASTRIAARKRTAAELAEVRRQKRILVLDKEAVAAAAARPAAIPLGPRVLETKPPATTQSLSATTSTPAPTTSSPLIAPPHAASSSAPGTSVTARMVNSPAASSAKELLTSRATSVVESASGTAASATKAPSKSKTEKTPRTPKGPKTKKASKTAKATTPLSHTVDAPTAALPRAPAPPVLPETQFLEPIPTPDADIQPSMGPAVVVASASVVVASSSIALPPEPATSRSYPGVSHTAPRRASAGRQSTDPAAVVQPAPNTGTALTTTDGDEYDESEDEFYDSPQPSQPLLQPVQSAASAAAVTTENTYEHYRGRVPRTNLTYTGTPPNPTALPNPPFEWSAFLRQFRDGAPVVSAPAQPAPAQSVHMDDVGTVRAAALTASATQAAQALFTEFMQYVQARELYSVPTTTPALPVRREQLGFDRGVAAFESWTFPNHRNELPPAGICNLRAADFGHPPVRARGAFLPAAVHSLAAHRLYPFLVSPEGAGGTPMAFVLHMRLLNSLSFTDAPPVLGATHSARFGRYGVTIMHCLRADRAAQRRAGSTDANFSLDFGTNVAPPPAPPCSSYTVLLGAIQGLTTFANSEWYPQMTPALYRLRDFVTANLEADPNNTPQRVQRTVDEVNHFLGSTFVHLSSDSRSWWRDFCAVVHRIAFDSATWALALIDTLAGPAEPAQPMAASASPPALGNAQHRVTLDTGDQSGHARPKRMPANIRALILRNDEGQSHACNSSQGPCVTGARGLRALITTGCTRGRRLCRQR